MGGGGRGRETVSRHCPRYHREVEEGRGLLELPLFRSGEQVHRVGGGRVSTC
jgi:hypothetical protein